MPFTVPYSSRTTVSSTTVETARTVVLTRQPSPSEGKLCNGCEKPSGLGEGGAQNSAVAAPGEAAAKDVEKERHYNAFMEARLKLGQTRTVAEPLKKLKAVQQQQTDVKVLRRGSAPVFSQAMLKRPSERRQSLAKAATEIEAGVTSKANGVVAEPTSCVRPKSKSPPDARGSPRTSPVKSRPAFGTMNGGTTTTTVVTLADVTKKEAPEPRPKRVTTLRLTRKPETPDKNGQVEASPKSEGVANGTASEPTSADGKKALGPKRSTAGPVPIRRRPSKTATTTNTNGETSKNESHESGAKDSRADAVTGATSIETSLKSVVAETKSSQGTSEATAEQLKRSEVGDECSKSIEHSTRQTVSPAAAASEKSDQEVKSLQGPSNVGEAEPSKSSSVQSEAAGKTTMIRSATFAVESSVRKTTTMTRTSATKTQMQKVDIKDLRSVLRTPSPQPPKEDVSEEVPVTKVRVRTDQSAPAGDASGETTKSTNGPGLSDTTSKTPPKPEDRTPTFQSRFLKTNKSSDLTSKRSYKTLDAKTSLNGDDVDDSSPPGSVSEASTSGVSSMESTRRDFVRRPSSLSWDSDAFSTATPSPCDPATFRSRSISVESADLDETRTKTPTRYPSAHRPHSAYSTARWGRGVHSTSNGGSSSATQVGELWSDLTQEQAASAQAAEILDAESAHRMRLEKEVRELQSRCSQLQQQKDRIEMEVSESRMLRSLNAGIDGDLTDEEDSSGVSIYKQKYERALREAEMKRRQMSQQHEDDLEKQVMSRKAAEKKLAEALDDVEEGRQAANQWKRKAQKLSAELQDLQLIVEEHMSRNAELERKQRKFDGELSAAAEGLKQERCSKEKILREKESLYAEKLALEQELESVRLELEMQHTKLASLHKELDELTFSSHGEEEVAKLKRAKQEVERKARDQEEELEDLASQVQLLEQSKLRLEMALEKQRQEHRREVSNKEEELDEARAAAAKKLRNLEALLESEQEERHALARQKNELERRLAELSERPPPRDPEIERRLRRDLRRTRALLRDAQGMLEHARDGQATRTLVRQLKSQLEDAEFAKTAAVKARQGAEMELQEVQSQLEDVLRAKNESEGRCIQLSREKGALQIQLEEIEEEQAELMKKYKAAVQQMASDQKVISEQSEQILELETEKHHLREQVQDLSSKVEHMSCQAEESHSVRRLETRVRDLESRLELEQASKARLEGQVQRLKDQCNRLQEECRQAGSKEQQTQENCRKLQRQLRDLREDCTALQHREAEAQQRCHELEMALDNAETDLQGTRNDLKLACQRIQDLQAALEEDLDSGTDVLEDSDSDEDDEDVDSLLRKHGLGPTGAKPSACGGSSAAFSLNLTRALSLDYPL